MTKHNGTRSAILSLILILSLIMGTAAPAMAALKTHDVGVNASYAQAEAREMLDLINSFRTGDNAWEWNSSDTEKIWHNDLSPLQYDAELEEVAMLRAAELALLFDHTRPNGKDCFSAYNELGLRYSAAGENIAMGFQNGSSVFTAWCEENDPYSGQGHRRNILGADFNAVGVGHAIVGGTHYWVQEFAFKTVVEPEPLENNGELPAAGSVGTTGSSQGYDYTIDSDGTLTITACSLTGDVVIPSELNGHTVSRLAPKLFYSDHRLTSVYIPATVQTIGSFDYVFSYCASLKEINVDPASPYMRSIDGVLFNASCTELINYPCAKEDVFYSTPLATTYLCCTSFAANPHIRDLYINNKQATWADYTLAYDPDLTVHYIPGGTTETRARLEMGKTAEELAVCSWASHFETFSLADPGVPAPVGADTTAGTSEPGSSAKAPDLTDGYNTAASANKNIPANFNADEYLHAEDLIHGIYSVYIIGGIGSCLNTSGTMSSVGEMLKNYRVYEPGQSDPIDLHFFIYDVGENSEKDIADTVRSTLGDDYSKRIHIGSDYVFSDKHRGRALPVLNDKLESYFGFLPLVEFVTPDGEPFHVSKGYLSTKELYDIACDMAEYYSKKQHPTLSSSETGTLTYTMTSGSGEAYTHTVGNSTGAWADKIGQTVTFGRYVNARKHILGVEDITIERTPVGIPLAFYTDTFSGAPVPLKWTILSADGDTAMLISAEAVEIRSVQSSILSDYPATWKTSTIRSFLNGYGKDRNDESTDYTSARFNFIDTAFTPKEQDIICTTKVETPAVQISGFSLPGEEAAFDKLFLLSIAEYSSRYLGFNPDPLASDEKRTPALSDFISTQPIRYNYFGYSILTRSPGALPIQCSYIDSTGKVDIFGKGNAERVVVPVMFISISAYEKYCTENNISLFTSAETPKPTEAPKVTEAPKPTEAPKVTEAPKPTAAPAKPAKQTISKLTSTKKGQMTVKWKKNTKADGYEIQYSTKSNFASAKKTTVTQNTTVSKTVKSLTAGKTYYVRVRSFILVDGKKVYGTWSTKQKVKISK